MEHLRKIVKELERHGHNGNEDICIQTKEGSPTIVTVRGLNGSTSVYSSCSFDVDRLELRAEY